MEIISRFYPEIAALIGFGASLLFGAIFGC
jgi:hypothetical protein